MLKKQVTIILLLLILFSPLFISFTTTIQIWINKYKIFEQLENKNAVTISISKSKLHWVEEGKELLIDGNLFDVKAIKVCNNNYIIVSGLFDKQEDKLWNDIANERLPQNNTQEKIFKFLYKLTVPISKLQEINLFCFYKSKTYAPNFQYFTFQEPTLKLIKPPIF